MTGQGGWPMTVFLTPDGEPFYGGTYFPPEPRHGLPSFRQVLDAIAEAWRDAARRRGRARRRSSSQAVQQSARATPVRTSRSPTSCSPGPARTLRAQFEPAFGGLGRAPKFPTAPTLEFAAPARRRARARDGRPDARRDGRGRDVRPRRRRLPPLLGRRPLARAALREDALRQRAARARVPARLARAPARSATARSSRRPSATCCASSSCPSGGFASAQDADTDGVEGLTFTWTEEEGVPAELLEPFEHGRSIVRGELDPELRARLFEVRERRPKPLRDDKAIASWNGLALAALAEAARRLERPRLARDARAGSREFLLGPLSDADGRLLRSRREGRTSGTAYLDDYANVAHGLLELHVATGDLRWLREANRLARLAVELFADDEHGGFFLSPAGAERLVARTKELDDHPLPSGNSMLAHVLLRLAPDLRRRRARAARRLGAPARPCRRSSAPRRHSAGRCARSTCTSARRGSSRSSGPSTPRSRARRSRPGSRRRSSPSARPRTCRCWPVRISWTASRRCTSASGLRAGRPATDGSARPLTSAAPGVV